MKDLDNNVLKIAMEQKDELTPTKSVAPMMKHPTEHAFLHRQMSPTEAESPLKNHSESLRAAPTCNCHLSRKSDIIVLLGSIFISC